jgi:hypothetical protein
LSCSYPGMEKALTILEVLSLTTTVILFASQSILKSPHMHV